MGGQRIDIAVGCLQAGLRGAYRALFQHGAAAAELDEHLFAAGRILQQHLLAGR